MRPDISVVIPTFRRPEQLKQALQSVLAQDLNSLEIIVVDDSPEGAGRATCEAIGDARIFYLKNPAPSGGVPSRVRNLGFQRCKGELVHFLDDDDVVAEGYYRKASAVLAVKPKVGLVFGRIQPFGEGPSEQLARERDFFEMAARRARICGRLGDRWPFVAQMLFGRVLLVCSAAILRRRCVEAANGFDENIVLHEDRDFFIRVMRQSSAAFCDVDALHYRIGYPSLMHSQTPSERQMKLEREGARALREKYRKTYGGLEFVAMKAAARALGVVDARGVARVAG